MKEATDGADLHQQLLLQLQQQLTGQKSGHQEPGDPEGALVKHQVGFVVVASSTRPATPPLTRHATNYLVPLC